MPRWWWIIVGFVNIKMTLDMEGLRSLSLGPWRGIIVILIGGIPLTPLPRLVVEPWFKWSHSWRGCRSSRLHPLVTANSLQNMATAHGMTVKDVSPHEFVKAYAAHLKRTGKVN